MPDIIARLAADSLQARRDRAEHATLLVAVLSDINNRGKNDGGRAPTVEDAVLVLDSYIASLDSNLALESLSPTNRALCTAQRELLDAYRPERLVGQALADAITNAAEANGLPLEMKSMKRLLEVLVAQYPGKIKGSDVSGYIKSLA